MYDLNKKGFIPLSKYWTLRLGFLDIINGQNKFLPLVDHRQDFGDDIKAMIQISKEWKRKDEHNVGEAGTLFRFLQFASWKFGLNKKFLKEKTLPKREICEDPEIVNWPISELVKLDHQTSQWASAAILCGCEDDLSVKNFFLDLTREALEHYNSKKGTKEFCELRYDQTLSSQAETFLNLLKGKESNFKIVQPDDYCFARALGLTNKEEGGFKWPELKGHESNRLEEMEIMLDKFEKGEEIDSKDHRVVQAIAMLSILKSKKAKFSHPECVSKSWPQFWNFLEFAIKDQNHL